MKGLIIITALIMVTGIGALSMANIAINETLAEMQPETSPTASVGLTVPDSGYNSATDLVQTAAGVDFYQADTESVQ